MNLGQKFADLEDAITRIYYDLRDIERRQLASAVDRFATRVPKRYGSHDWTTWVRQ